MLTCPFCGAQCAPGEHTCLTCGSTLASAPDDRPPLFTAAAAGPLGLDGQLAGPADPEAVAISPPVAVHMVAWWRLAMLGMVVCLGLSAAALLGFTGLLGPIRPTPATPPAAPATASSGAATVPATDSSVTAPAGKTPTDSSTATATATSHSGGGAPPPTPTPTPIPTRTPTPIASPTPTMTQPTPTPTKPSQ